MANETGPKGAELDAILRRVGCRRLASHALWSGREADEIECPTHRAKVKLLAALAEWDAQQPQILELGRSIAATTDGSHEAIARALHAWQLEHVTFLPEPRELFRSAQRTIEDGIGDCDDASRVLLALLRSCGLRAGLATLGSPPTHVAVAVQLGRRWLWAESTVPGAQIGEHPHQAVKRSAQARADIGAITPQEENELRQSMVEFAGIALLAVAGRAALAREWPSVTEIFVATTGAAWTPVALHLIREWWHSVSTAPTEPAPEVIDPEVIDVDPVE